MKHYVYSSPPNDIKDWEDYFEHHFLSPTYHVGWDRTFEANEDLTDERIIADIFDKEDIKHYSQVKIDESLHVFSETLNNHFKEHGALLNYD